jgi:hypothetical protein
MLGNRETRAIVASYSFLMTRRDERLGNSAPSFFRFSGFIAAEAGGRRDF